jgi:peptide/nickel transport system substrate-binding protein
MANKITRRNFLKASAVTVLGAAVAACAQPTPTAVPTKPAAAATNTPVPVAPTAKPAEPTKPAAAATAAPTKPAAPTYKEAPALAEQVKAGKLPPVDQRLPQDPLVLEAVEKVGKYGGELRMITTDGANFGTIGGYFQVENFAKWRRDYQGHRPNIVSKWSWNAAGTELTMYLRKGVKWSDGAPFTWDDWLFWWNDMINDTKVNLPRQTGTHTVGGAMKTDKIDDFTLKLTWPDPNPLFIEVISRGSGARASGWQIVPAHYMKKFHPKYNTAIPDTKELLDRYNNRRLYPDMPTYSCYMLKEYKQREYMTLVRNPYYWKTDTEGNQLPYIDTVNVKAVADNEVLKLLAINGDVDITRDAFGIKDIALMKENEKKGSYRTVLLKCGDAVNAGTIIYYCGPDKKLVNLLWNQKFRQALSWPINRERMNDIVFLGTAKPRNFVMWTDGPEFASPRGQKIMKEWSTNWATYQPDTAKKLLDELGVKDVNNDGYREYPDGTPLEITVDVDVASPYDPDCHKLAQEDYKAIGIKYTLNVISATVLEQRATNCETVFRSRGGAAGGLFIAQGHWTPVEAQSYCICGYPYGQWFQTGGKQGLPPPPEAPWMKKLQDIYAEAIIIADPVKRTERLLDGYQVHIDDGPIQLGFVGDTVQPGIIHNKLHNVQDYAIVCSGVFGYPGTLDPEHWWKE